jgi:precorrin-8X/cobalt-precorrin-8 methylmutase
MAFDRIIVVDWSANARPKLGADSIWIGMVDATAGEADPVNVATRRAAIELLVERCAEPGRVLVGFDFPFGYPSGLGAAMGLIGTPWEATWEHLAATIVDEPSNANNRWEVAADLNARRGALWFWGAPPRRTGPWLTATKPASDSSLPAYRLVEERLRSQGLRPFSGSQLLGAGSVGSQALTGIPAVHRLRHHPRLAHRALVWPFETGLAADPAADVSDAVVMAEVWPSAISFDHVDHPVKDARQVTALAIHLAELDTAGRMGAMFAPHVALAHRDEVEGEEGWVLGVE